MKILAIFLLVLSLSPRIIAADYITDSLVANLSCDQVTPENIYAHIRPDAFDLNKHLPIHNWSFKKGPYKLGVCWSLSHTQRIFYYLARWQDNEPEIYGNEEDVIHILNLIRGSQPVRGALAKVKEQRLKRFSTFSIDSFSLDAGIFSQVFTGVWDELPFAYNLKSLLPEITPLTELTDFQSEDDRLLSSNFNPEEFPQLANFPNFQLFRQFKTEIEKYQTWRFHQLKNSPLIKEPVPRPQVVNARTAQELVSFIDQRRLPLVDIKVNLNTQHIVLVKSYEKIGEEIIFHVYDSNYPQVENSIIFSSEQNQFRASSIIRKFRGVKNAEQFVSVYIIDNEDHQKIERALLEHYQQACKVPQANIEPLEPNYSPENMN